MKKGKFRVKNVNQKKVQATLSEQNTELNFLHQLENLLNKVIRLARMK